ncbi:hypothetical protein BHC46_06430 [Snodgrassella alvi]|uniref:Uncharacterized protein n=1 Tax=Snodgrassella alvi TaxID=1196083 RepID=A0A2N9XHU9_9NEIS|nr:hypothetical protein BHC46_06430 [Snodgrassella alvi]
MEFDFINQYYKIILIFEQIQFFPINKTDSTVLSVTVLNIFSTEQINEKSEFYSINIGTYQINLSEK